MDEDLMFNVPLQDVKRELRRGIIECQKRGLLHSMKWLAEMAHGLKDVNIDADSSVDENCLNKLFMEGIDAAEYDEYLLAKSYFDVREYKRAAYFVRNCESSVPKFLHMYATYMTKEKRRLDSVTDSSNLADTEQVNDLAELLATLRTEYSKGRLDGYGMYLYGIVLKSLNLNHVAMPILIEAIKCAPMLWAAYLELAPLISEKRKLLEMHMSGHWMRSVFTAHTYLELYLNDEALKAYEDLQTAGFRKCVYVISQMALAYHNKRDVEKSIEIFQLLQETDPYRLDNLDTYSNLLFVKEMKTEMAELAHKVVDINKYRPETCCVIGNYYSIRSDHQQAILYFQRALKLNPKYLAAWTLMGHEFMELKNTNAAIQSYRKAVEVNKRDYRAWYGLGQCYEILKMYYYSLYYFKIAHRLRPYDSRMLVALGETYEKLEKTDNAIKCFWKACDVGDIEGIAMYKLASLHEKLGQFESAVQCYIMYCEDERASADKQSLFNGYMTLANYYESKGQYDRASHYAYKCLESDDRKAEAKSLLKTIENKRGGKHTPVINAAEKPTTPADTSSDDAMDMELSDDNSLANEKSKVKTPKAPTRTHRGPVMSARLSIPALSRSIALDTSSTTGSTTPTEAPTTSRAPRTRSSRRALRDDDDDDSQSMELSSISID